MRDSHRLLLMPATVIIVLGVAFDLVAQPSPGQWGPKSCVGQLSNGNWVIVECTVTIDDCAQSEDGGICDESNRYRYCMSVCNDDGDVVDIRCVCACEGREDNDPPEDPDCLANP